MRRLRLPPARPVRVAGPFALDPAARAFAAPAGAGRARPEGPAVSPGDDLGHERLAGPRPARPRLRRLFNPVSGWFRRLERRTNIWLCKAVYPRLPGAHLPYAWQLDRHLTVSEADIALPHLPVGFDGMKVLLVTDLHAGPFLSPAALGRAFDRLLSLEPELIVLGGDLTTGRVEEFDPFAPLFTRVARACPVYAVLGNHDHYSGDPMGLVDRIEATGIPVLHNDSVTLWRNGSALRLAGIDDLYCGEPDLDAALANPTSLGRSRQATNRSAPALTSPSETTILLSHNPDIFFAARRHGVSLVLAGHTHGGQIRIPGLPVLVRMSRYRLDEGHYTAGDAQLVVSRGLGVTGLPLRIFCPPEAVLLRLRLANRPSRVSRIAPEAGASRCRTGMNGESV